MIGGKMTITTKVLFLKKFQHRDNKLKTCNNEGNGFVQNKGYKTFLICLF